MLKIRHSEEGQTVCRNTADREKQVKVIFQKK